MFAGFTELTQLPPLARFSVAMLILFAIPPLCRRVRLPAVVGLMAAGVLIGPFGLQLAPKHGEVVEFFAELGKLLLMFFAGMEIDLVQFNRTRNRSIGFGLLTFALPLTAGLLVGLWAGYPWVGALLIGSLLASHTLIAYPIVEKLGKLRNEAVTVTIGATVFTDVAALLVLAVCIPIHVSGFAPDTFAIQVLQLGVYVPAVILGLGWVAQKLFARKPPKEGQFALMLLLVAVAAVAAEAIHLEGIIGAFLAGLAVNTATRDSEAKHELEFIGNHLFIPVFFLTIGFLIDLQTFANTLVTHFWLVFGIVGGLIGSKYLAAEIARRAFGYSRTRRTDDVVAVHPPGRRHPGRRTGRLQHDERGGRAADRRTRAELGDRAAGGHLRPGADPDREIRQTVANAGRRERARRKSRRTRSWSRSASVTPWCESFIRRRR